jgi:type VI secretion system protein ImpH
MAGTFGRSPRDLIQELRENAARFGFFQAVRIFILGTPRRRGERATLPPKLRFRTLTSLAFPASELTQYRPAPPQETPDGEPVAGIAIPPQEPDELTVTFMGMTGPSGVLPRFYTELLIDRQRLYRDNTAHAFFDLFSHRIISLFYSAWRKYRFWVNVEEGDRNGFTRNLLDFTGLGAENLRKRLGTKETAGAAEELFAYYAGLLAQKPISAQAISTLVEGFFGVRTEIIQFVGQWIEVPLPEQTRPGISSCNLGTSFFAGDRIWDRQTKISMRLGPMRRHQFQRMLPGGQDAEILRALVHFMLGHGLACDVTMVLDRRDSRPPLLNQEQPLVLGGDVWLAGTYLPRNDLDQMSYRLLQ